jgi:hypothetical protein
VPIAQFEKSNGRSPIHFSISYFPIDCIFHLLFFKSNYLLLLLFFKSNRCPIFYQPGLGEENDPYPVCQPGPLTEY